MRCKVGKMSWFNGAYIIFIKEIIRFWLTPIENKRNGSLIWRRQILDFDYSKTNLELDQKYQLAV